MANTPGNTMLFILRSKTFLLIAALPFVPAFAVLAYYLSIEDLTIFPNSDQFQYAFYDDRGAGGNSELIHSEATDSCLRIDFRLKKGIESPYVGITVSPKTGALIPARRYNRLNIGVSAKNLDNIGIAFYAANPYPEKANRVQEIPFYTTMTISPTPQRYSIDFTQLKTPDWWYELNNLNEATTRQPEIPALKNINIGNAYTPNAGQEQSLQIRSIALSRDNVPLAILLGLLELAIILTTFMVMYWIEKNRSRKKSVTINYQPVEGRSVGSPKSDFIDFINRNFQNSELTVELVSGETGASPRKITNDIQAQFACNFKTYLNRLRINESKRLLAETDLNIGEISFRVGFNNQSHFNRVFKSEVQISPTVYRDSCKTRR